MLGQHPELYGFPELKLFAWDQGDAHRAPGLVRAIAEVVFRGQSPACLASASGWLEERASWSGRDLSDELQRRIAPRRAVEKSPEHALSDQALGRICDAYPQARFVHLVRHPLTTADSMRRHMRLTDADATTFCLFTWYETNFRLVELGTRLGRSQVVQVQAETTLSDPKRELARVAAWLGLRTDFAAVDAMLHPERSSFARPVVDPSLGDDNDPGFLRAPHLRPVISPPPLVPPVDWTGPDRLWTAITNLSATFGYAVASTD